MPITVPDGLPSIDLLRKENIFTINKHRATHQDIRPLKILILNLMPKKIETETQLLRMLSNTPLQMEVELLQVSSHISKNTSQEHLLKFYRTFPEVISEKFDGMIITGAPVEQMPFEEVDYWSELCSIMEWTKNNVYSTLISVGAPRQGSIIIMGFPNMIFLTKCLEFLSKRRWFLPISCLWDLTILSPPLIPATPKSAPRTSTRRPGWKFSPHLPSREYIWWDRWTADSFSSPVTASMIGIPWQMNIFGM